MKRSSSSSSSSGSDCEAAFLADDAVASYAVHSKRCVTFTFSESITTTINLFCSYELSPFDMLEFSKPDAARDPTGHKVWLSAEIMPHILAARRYSSAFSAMPLPRIVELGSGTGLCGIAAASLGFSTTLTDGEPEVVSLLKRNVALNRFEDSTFVEHLFVGCIKRLGVKGHV